MAIPETPTMQIEQEVNIESVFGDAPTQSEADKDSDPQSIWAASLRLGVSLLIIAKQTFIHS